VGFLLVALAAVLTACFLIGGSPFDFIPDNANIMRHPKGNWVVYIFPADFNSVIPEAKLELTSLGFVEAKHGFDDPNETRRFGITYSDGRTHDVEIFNKNLGLVGTAATERGWVSISIHRDLYFELRKKRFIRGIERLISRVRDK